MGPKVSWNKKKQQMQKPGDQDLFYMEKHSESFLSLIHAVALQLLFNMNQSWLCT